MFFGHVFLKYIRLGHVTPTNKGIRRGRPMIRYLELFMVQHPRLFVPLNGIIWITRTQEHMYSNTFPRVWTYLNALFTWDGSRTHIVSIIRHPLLHSQPEAPLVGSSSINYCQIYVSRMQSNEPFGRLILSKSDISACRTACIHTTLNMWLNALPPLRSLRHMDWSSRSRVKYASY